MRRRVALRIKVALNARQKKFFKKESQYSRLQNGQQLGVLTQVAIGILACSHGRGLSAGLDFAPSNPFFKLHRTFIYPNEEEKQ